MKLVNRVLPRQELYTETERVARIIASYDPGRTSAKQAITRG